MKTTDTTLIESYALSPEEALRTATANAADAFRLADRERIRAGLRADFLLIECDPAIDINTTRNIVGVWKAGSKVDRDA